MRELLLCPPDYYGIEYEINPWMSRARGAETELAKSQWQGLHKTLASLDSKIELVPPQPKLPDMVFTANAGLAIGRKFIPSNVRHEARAGEAPYFVRWMEEQGYEIHRLPENLYFEGEGDALFAGDALFCGYKFRSDIKSHRAVAEMLGCLVVSRSEEHTSELQSHSDLVCRLLLEKKNKRQISRCPKTYAPGTAARRSYARNRCTGLPALTAR